MARYTLALDVGTSSIHCLLDDPTGSPVATASAPMQSFRPEGQSSLAREFDPEAALDTMGQLVRTVVEEGRIGKDEVSAIGLTSQRQGVVFLDDRGKELYSGPNLDLRALFEGAAMDEQAGPEIYATTGHFPSLLLAPARLKWFRDNLPPIFERTETILTIGGWLEYRLTGKRMSEAALETETGLLDVINRRRRPSLLEKLGVPLSLLPPLPEEGVPMAAIDHPMAEQWSLRPGTPVVLAGPDTQCGILGMGLVREGQAGVVAGWSGALQILTSRPCHDDRMRTWVGLYPLEGLWVAESNLGDAGNAYRWLKDTLLGPERSFEEAEELAQLASAASEGVVALLGPSPLSAAKTGYRMGGLLFPTPLSFQEASRGQLFRAALENVAFSVKANLETLAEVTGLDSQPLYLGGGMANSRTLAATLAKVIGVPVRRSKFGNVSAMGAAMIAWAATDTSTSLREIGEAGATGYEEFEPGTAGEVAQHQEYYQQWLRLYNSLEWNRD